jgi:hypothetical protein
MQRWDSFPREVREALMRSPFYLDITIPHRGLNWALVAERIRALKTTRDAADFMFLFAPGLSRK